MDRARVRIGLGLGSLLRRRALPRALLAQPLPVRALVVVLVAVLVVYAYLTPRLVLARTQEVYPLRLSTAQGLSLYCPVVGCVRPARCLLRSESGPGC